MKRPRTLTASFVKTVTATGRYGDGRGGFGLSLLVKPMANGRISKTWSQRLRWNGVPFMIGLGAYPLINLSEARALVLANAREVANGRDPRTTGIPTFEAAADIVIQLHRDGWKDAGKTEGQWRGSLRDYAMPIIGRKPVNKVTAQDVMAVLTPHWQSKHVTMKRVRNRISAIMQWAVVQGYRQDNPAGDAIGSALPKNGTIKQHHAALPYAEVADAVAKVRKARVWPLTPLAMEFLILTAARSGEVRGMTWDEIDMNAATWTIPASRMKAKREHRVPLSDRAMDILTEAKDYEDESGVIFVSPRGGKPLSENAISNVLKQAEVPCVAHGFRSSFRDWCAECTDAPREVAEMALAHVEGSAVERAYRRTDLFEHRRKLMTAWADYIAG